MSNSVVAFRAGLKQCEAIVPDSHNGKVVLYHGGTGEGEYTWRRDSQKFGIRSALLGAGYVIVVASAGPQNWGAPAAIDTYEAVIRWIDWRWPNRSKLLHLSQSMGGLSALTMIANGVEADGWAGIYPVCSLSSMYPDSDIDAAYDIPGSGDYATASAGYDPVLRSGTLFTLPMRFYASPDDTAVTKTENSDAMATLVGAYATESEVVVCSGNHGNSSHFQPSDLLAFFDRC